MALAERAQRQKQGYELDYSEMLRQAYYDCIVALNAPVSDSMPIPSIGNVFQQRVAFDRFEGCVDILKHMILDSLKDDKYKEDIAPTIKTTKKDDGWEEKTMKKTVPRSPNEIFHAITELFNRKGILKELRAELGHV